MTHSSNIAAGVSARNVTVEPSPDAASRAADRGATPDPMAGSFDWRDAVAPFASLRLTVWLLVLSIFLTFAGTLAQVDKGIWRVMDEYFRCGIAWIELRIFFPRSWTIPSWSGFWFPGGWLLGGLLLTNLLAAHAVRFRVKKDAARLVEGSAVIAACCVAFGLMLAELHFHVAAFRSYNAEMGLILVVSAVLFVGCRLVFGKRAGIAMLHGGLIFLLISEIITGLFAVEARMTIREGETVNFVEHARNWELAVIDPSDPSVDRVTVVPGSMLAAAAESGKPITHPDLPFDLTVGAYYTNSSLVETGPNVKNPATAGDGLQAVAVRRDEFSGAGAEASNVDVVSAYVTVTGGGANAEETYLVSGFLSWQDRPQVVRVGSTPYQMYLRFKRTYEPFSLHLIDFQHKTYQGTDTPHDYRSIVQLTDPTTGDDRQVQIYMNHPLRHAGKTFFQSSFLEGDAGTVLQVVDNPGRLVPYIACFLVGVGLVGHFITHLIHFLSHSRKRALA